MQTTESAMGEVFFALCKTIDTPLSLGAWLRYKYSHIELSTMDVSPRDYRNARDFHIDYSVVKFLSKYKGLSTGVDLEAVALQKFTQSEAQCRDTNLRFKNLATVRNGRLHGVLHAAQRKIARLLGPFSLDLVSGDYGWGPGATRDLPRRRAFVDTKMCELPISVTRSARSLLAHTIVSDLHWSEVVLGTRPEGDFSFLPSVFVVTDECKITTVEKDARSNRVIAIEPRGNSFLQKGFGGYIRDRLRRVGIDLSNQGRNQELARQAYSERLATLDLKAASDSVALELVWALLPPEWASALDAVRSRWALLPNGDRIRLEKFSSMGNGFTFELETLIFWALVSSVSDQYSGGTVAVYGDDIICDREVATDVALTLQFCGFLLNDEKSYFDGNFFESCGKHFFQGIDVTPAYQKETVEHPLASVRLGNRLIRLAYRLGLSRKLDKRLEPAWRAARRVWPYSTRWFLPFGVEGDDGWLLPYSEFPFLRQSVEDLCNHGIRCRVAKPQSKLFPANDLALLAWSFRRGILCEEPYQGFLKRDAEVPVPHDGHRKVIPSGQFSILWD